MYRQGDVLIIPVTAGGEPQRTIEDNVLAHGEATGHAHRVVAVQDGVVVPDADKIHLYEGRDGKMYLRVDGEVEVRHEEHETIPLPPGQYEIRRQREYTPDAIRFVAD